MIRLLALLFLSSTLFGGPIAGFWKAVDEKTGRARCIVAVYDYGGRHFGRIVATFDKRGRMAETIYSPYERAPGIMGEPYYCGMDIIWDLKPGKKSFEGKIIDPEGGSVYNCELWTRGENLVVRGKLLCFGKNQTWVAATEQDFLDFAKPNVAEFVPNFPKPK